MDQNTDIHMDFGTVPINRMAKNKIQMVGLLWFCIVSMFEQK